MIILVHDGEMITSVLNENLKPIEVIAMPNTMMNGLKTIIESAIEDLVIWCHEKLVTALNIPAFETVFHHERLLLSFNTNKKNYIPDQIGYIERSFFIKINTQITYPTWLMSSHVGGMNTKIFKYINYPLNVKVPFDYFLSSLSKSAMVQGLFCYSEPRLLKHNTTTEIETIQASKFVVFKFVKQHYKWVWSLFLACCYFIYEKQLPLYSLLGNLKTKRVKCATSLEKFTVKSSRTISKENTIDVIIPTIGRKKYLYDVLLDLANQTHLPKNVIIVEQNPIPDSHSDLDYLTSKKWPFIIKHEFIKKIGVCNARNIALSKVESEWTFLADDDIRFNHSFLEASLQKAKQYGITVLNYSCLQPQQKQTFFKIHQTTVFGSGSSMVQSKLIQTLAFNTAYEFGFGEDTEFGIQIRNQGGDVIYIPDIKITHLKAPIGGFRTKIKHLWEDEEIQPKPSPTIQLLYNTHYTQRQLKGYKLLLFLQEFIKIGYKTPFKFKTRFIKRWNKSVYWSSKLRQASHD